MSSSGKSGSTSLSSASGADGSSSELSHHGRADRSSVKRPGPLREIATSEGLNGSLPRQQSDDEVAERMRWLNDEHGWLWPKEGGVGRLKFKFSENSDGDPFKLQWSQVKQNTKGSPAGDRGPESPVVTYLRNAKALKVEAHVGEEVTLGKALQASKPVPKLESLEVQCYVGQTVTDGVLDAMRARKFIALKTLFWVEHNLAVQEGYIQRLADVIAMGSFPSLNKLDLYFDHFNLQVGLESLATSLKGLDSLQYLRVRGKSMGKGHSALADVMRAGHLQALQVLCLTRTGIEDAHCEEYGEAFRSGNVPMLQELHFGSNEIQAEGAAALGKVFAAGHFAKLTVLDLSKNWIGNEGMRALAKSFHEPVGGVNLVLKVLNLQSNDFTARGLDSLSAVLSSGFLDALEILQLRYNKSSTEEGVQGLIDAMSSNSLLTVNVDIEWERYPELELQKEQLLKRNRKNSKTMIELRGRQTPATFARVYVCGSQQVGKTTLRKTMGRSAREALLMWERRPHVEKPTRGIDVSTVVSKSSTPEEKTVTMMLWDMAGQEEYLLLHSSFFPDLAFAEGRATGFIVVCSSKNEANAVRELEYWLRFIASSCGKSVHNPRHVFVVFNRMRGSSDILNRAPRWKGFLQEQRSKFEGYLEIQTDLYTVDARRRSDVQDLKENLIKNVRSMLEGQKVPEICHFIQSNLAAWSQENERFPVLCWPDFVKKVQSEKSQWPEETLEAAAKYLNEAGIVIYINKEFPADWRLPSKRVLVLNPSWFCSEVVGNMLLPDKLAEADELPFGVKVEKSTGSISISEFRKHFRKFPGNWDDTEIDGLLGILLWLGVCYKGREDNIYVPALIQEDRALEERWFEANPLDHEEGRWVMGFTIEHRPSEIALAPITVWRRYQVDLAQNPEYNGHADNDFLVGKSFVTFKIDYMTVLIKVNTSEEWPTFDGVDIFVKPLPIVDNVDSITRKLRQVERASNLGEKLRQLWNEVCPGVRYVHRVVWPWPASWGSRPTSEDLSRRNVEVKEVKQWVGEHGLGRPMHWTVGTETITEDQLLSRRAKEQVLERIQDSVSFIRTGIKEGVDLGIFPSEILHEEEKAETPKGIHALPPTPTSPDDLPTQKVLAAVRDLRTLMSVRHREVMTELSRLHDLGQANLKLTEEVKFLMKTRNDMLNKVHDMGEVIFQDRESTCPRFIYLGEQGSGKWVTLKQAISPSVKTRVHFACEAKYSDYVQHPVENQQGINVSEMKDWAKKIAPWLRVSAAVLSISARVAANAVAPGLGLIIPDFEQWQQASSLSEGIALAIGFSQEEMDSHMEGMHLDIDASQAYPQELHRYSKKLMADYLNKLSPQEFEGKLGLSKVHLVRDPEGRSTHSVAWICRDCYRKFRSVNMVRDLD